MNSIEQFNERIALIGRSTEVFEKDPNHNQKYIKELIKELSYYTEYISSLLKSRANVYLQNTNTPKIEELKNKINVIDNYYILDEAITNYYNAFKIQELVYKITNPKTLEDFNTNLNFLIQKYYEMGIILSIKDFNYTDNVTEYMESFFKETSIPGNELMNQNMKTVFDKIYWENHEILNDIVLNINNIIKKYDKKVKEYVSNKKDSFIKENVINENTIDDAYYSYKDEAKKLNDININNLVNAFKNDYNIDDFAINSEVLKNNRNKFINDVKYEMYNDKEKREVYNNISNLLENLLEYEMYDTFSFLIKEAKNIYDKKTEYIGSYNSKLKVVASLEKTKDKSLKKCNILNKKYNKLLNKRMSLFLREKKKNQMLDKLLDKKKQADNILARNIMEIRTEKSDIDRVKFMDNLAVKLTESNTVYDVFNYYNHDYTALITAIKNSKEDITDNEINDYYNSFKDFMYKNDIKIVKAINFVNPEKIDEVIEERYKLFDFNIKIGEVTSNTFKDLKKSCEFIKIYRDFHLSSIPSNVIKVILEMM